MMRRKSSSQLAAGVLLLVAAGLYAAAVGGGRHVFEHATPQATEAASAGVYSDDPRDSWNRIFRALFTRTVRARLSEEFREGAPFTGPSVDRPRLRVSGRLFTRMEEGDRAVEPLYPSLLGTSGPNEVLDEPLFSELRAALTDALADTRARTPLARALMQTDAWAAFDLLYATMPSSQRARSSERRLRSAHREELLRLLGAFVRQLALEPSEIAALPDNFRLGARAGLFPDLFAPDSAWREVEWGKPRLHDHEANLRRAARVFVLPAAPHKDDAQQFFDGLRNSHERVASEVRGVALVIQNLLLDAEGRPVPSPITYETQFRFFDRDAAAPAVVTQFELSRRLLLSTDTRGGFTAHDGASAHYLPSAGNDYRFASLRSDARGVERPLVVRLGTRCAACHGDGARHVFTSSGHFAEDTSPPVELLDPSLHERALYVAGLKTEREDFKALMRYRRAKD